jgi:hypothetical protein
MAAGALSLCWSIHFWFLQSRSLILVYQIKATMQNIIKLLIAAKLASIEIT